MENSVSIHMAYKKGHFDVVEMMLNKRINF